MTERINQQQSRVLESIVLEKKKKKWPSKVGCNPFGMLTHLAN